MILQNEGATGKGGGVKIPSHPQLPPRRTSLGFPRVRFRRWAAASGGGAGGVRSSIDLFRPRTTDCFGQDKGRGFARGVDASVSRQLYDRHPHAREKVVVGRLTRKCSALAFKGHQMKRKNERTARRTKTCTNCIEAKGNSTGGRMEGCD